MRQATLTIQVSLAQIPLKWLTLVDLPMGTRDFMPDTETESFQVLVAASIARAIENAGFRTQDEFARVIGMDRSTLRRVLSGKYDPKLSTLQRIADGLEMPLDDLLKTDASQAISSLQRKGRKPVEKPHVVQIQITLAPGEQLPEWIKDCIENGSAKAIEIQK